MKILTMKIFHLDGELCSALPDSLQEPLQLTLVLSVGQTEVHRLHLGPMVEAGDGVDGGGRHGQLTLTAERERERCASPLPGPCQAHSDCTV